MVLTELTLEAPDLKKRKLNPCHNCEGVKWEPNLSVAADSDLIIGVAGGERASEAREEHVDQQLLPDDASSFSLSPDTWASSFHFSSSAFLWAFIASSLKPWNRVYYTLHMEKY